MNQDGEGMTVREAGKKGGDIVKTKYGPQFYAEIGRKGGESTKRRHGSQFYGIDRPQGRSAPKAHGHREPVRMTQAKNARDKQGGEMTVREAGKRGGDAVRAKYGPTFYEEIGRKGGKSTEATSRGRVLREHRPKRRQRRQGQVRPELSTNRSATKAGRRSSG